MCTFAGKTAKNMTETKRPELACYDMNDGHVLAFSTTRRGGVSTGNYAEFNINQYCGDEAQAVGENRLALCRLLGLAPDRLIMPHQTHQTRVVRIDEPFLGLPGEERQQALEGVDALMTDVEDVCIGVSTADCIPVLLYDRRRRCACAVHAGWRGTVARICEKAVREMGMAYGSDPTDVVAQIGPGISLESFEVGQEVYDAFRNAGFGMESISRQFPSASGEVRWHIDLPLCNSLQLQAVGVPATAIATSPVCTFKQHDRFFSARRLDISSGRIFTGIIISSSSAFFH